MTEEEYPLLGARREDQLRAIVELNLSDDGLRYEQLKERLELDHDAMQKVIRGINSNGLAERTFDEQGRHVYISNW